MSAGESTMVPGMAVPNAIRRYNTMLLIVSGLGGLLYGVDVGVIGGAYPYIEATSHFTAGQLSSIVAAVLLGSVLSTMFAGVLADGMGRKPLMLLSGMTFVLSIPVIALAPGYWSLLFGRLLQGVSAGLIGVVVPLYLAECLAASHRGKGTAVFQWMLTLGIVAAALVGIYFSYRVAAVEKLADTATLLRFEDRAWRSIFWVSLPPGVLFVLGSFLVTESPRWLFRRGRRDRAQAALLRSRTADQAAIELDEMASLTSTATSPGEKTDSLFQRKYAIPFLLACVILACNTATGVNSIIGYNTGILMQSGLSDLSAHWGYVVFTIVNFAMTAVGMTLIDRKGRKFLFVLGTSGIIVALVSVGIAFMRTEKSSIDARSEIEKLVTPQQTLGLRFDSTQAAKILEAAGDSGDIDPARASLAIIYSYGDFTAATSFVRSDAATAPIEITRASCVPTNRVVAFFEAPFANLDAAQSAPLRIEKAVVGRVPSSTHGWLVALGIYMFMAFYALGPGVCVWLALSELMPTRIRSNGMSIALVINQLVSTTLAGIFLPFVSKHGYAAMFFLFASFTVVYFIVTAFFLPETKGKTLEEIEAHFARKIA